MGDMSGGNSSMDNHTLSEHDCYSNSEDMSSGNVVINIHNLSQCDDSITFKETNGDVENGDVSSGYGSIKTHTIYQHNVTSDCRMLN